MWKEICKDAEGKQQEEDSRENEKNEKESGEEELKDFK